VICAQVSEVSIVNMFLKGNHTKQAHSNGWLQLESGPLDDEGLSSSASEWDYSYPKI